MKKSNIAIAVAAGVFAGLFAGMASAAGTGNLWGNAYTDYKINDTKNKVVLGVEGGFTNSQGGAWAGLEQNVTDDAQWIGIGGHYNIHGDVAVYGVTEYDYDESRDWSASMYKGGVQFTGLKGDGWSTKQYVGVKTTDATDSERDTYGIVGASVSYQLAPNLTTFASIDGSAQDNFLTEVDVGLKYTVPNIPGAYVAATYETDTQSKDNGKDTFEDSWKIRVGYSF